MAQIDACERLLNNMTDKISDSAITKEIAELKMALDLLP
jgi:hypothetical protein